MDISASIRAFSDTTLGDAVDSLEPGLIAAIVREAADSDPALASKIHGAVLSAAYANNEISINKRDVVSDPSKAKTPRATSKASKGAAPVAAKPERQARAVKSKPSGDSTPKAAKGGGVKRDPSVMAAIVDKVETYITENPGQGTEAIGRALNMKTKDLQLPMRKLGDAKKITSKGEKRATRYFPAS